MKDEITKPLLKGDNITLLLKVNDGKLRLGANQLEGSFLQLREKEKLEVVLREGSIVVLRRPDVDPAPPVLDAVEDEE